MKRSARGLTGRVRLGLLCVLVAATAACSDSGENDRRRGARAPAEVITQPARFLEDTTRIEAVGTARARASVIVYAETGGTVTEVLFEAGGFVEEGAPLVRLEDAEERLAVNLAEVSVREAEQLLARYRRIESTGAVSDSQIDEAQTALDAARIGLDQARVALAERTVAAPFAGHVGLTDVDPGARITTTTVITRLDDRRTLFVDFQVPEQVFGRLQPGDPVEVRPFAGENSALQADILSIDSRIDETRRSFAVRAVLDNTQDLLRPGMSFRIALTLPGERFPAVPEAAVVWGSDGSYLWLVREGTARQIPVGIVGRRRGLVLVRGEIEEGAIVIVEGIQSAREGQAVQSVPRDGAPAEDASEAQQPQETTPEQSEGNGQSAP